MAISRAFSASAFVTSSWEGFKMKTIKAVKITPRERKSPDDREFIIEGDMLIIFDKTWVNHHKILKIANFTKMKVQPLKLKKKTHARLFYVLYSI